MISKHIFKIQLNTPLNKRVFSSQFNRNFQFKPQKSFIHNTIWNHNSFVKKEIPNFQNQILKRFMSEQKQKNKEEQKQQSLINELTIVQKIFQKGRELRSLPMVEFAIEMFFIILQAVVIYLLISEYIGNTFTVSGASMYPTFVFSSDRVIVEYVSAKCRNKSYEVGDIVMSYHPSHPNKLIVKRVRATEGSVVIVAGETPSEEKAYHVPKGFVWLEGDNPSLSIDSRQYGPVSLNLVRGRVIALVWPLDRIKIFTRYPDYYEKHKGHSEVKRFYVKHREMESLVEKVEEQMKEQSEDKNGEATMLYVNTTEKQEQKT